MPDCGKIYPLFSNLKNVNTNAKGTVVVVVVCSNSKETFNDWGVAGPKC